MTFRRGVGTSLAIIRGERTRGMNPKMSVEFETNRDAPDIVKDAIDWNSVSSLWTGTFEPGPLYVWRRILSGTVQNRSSGR